MQGLLRQRGRQRVPLLRRRLAVDGQHPDRPGGGGAEGDLRDREQRQVAGAAGEIAPGDLHQRRQERGGEMPLLALQGIDHRHRPAPLVVVVQSHGVEHRRITERRGEHLDVPGRRQSVAHRATAALERGEPAAGRRRRQHRRDVLQPLEAEDLLHQVRGQREVRSPGRRGDREQHLVVPGDRAPDLLQAVARGAGRVVHAGDAGGPALIERDGRHDGGGTDVGEGGLDRAAGDLGEQRRRPVQCGDRGRGVDTTLVPLARLTGELVTADRPEHREGVPHGGLEQDVRGLPGHLRARAAHDARQ